MRSFFFTPANTDIYESNLKKCTTLSPLFPLLDELSDKERALASFKVKEEIAEHELSLGEKKYDVISHLNKKFRKYISRYNHLQINEITTADNLAFINKLMRLTTDTIIKHHELLSTSRSNGKVYLKRGATCAFFLSFPVGIGLSMYYLLPVSILGYFLGCGSAIYSGKYGMEYVQNNFSTMPDSAKILIKLLYAMEEIHIVFKLQMGFESLEELPQYYSLLGLDYDASTNDVNVAFQKHLASKHPENLENEHLNGNAIAEEIEKSRLVKEAFFVLSNPKLCEQYNQARLSDCHIANKI